MENMPKDSHVKFNQDGQPVPYYGNTIVSFLNNPDSVIFQEAEAVQEWLKTSSAADHLAFLPPSSFHVTVLSLCREIDRYGEYWPRNIERDLKFRQIDRILKERFLTVPPLEGVRMEISEVDERHLLLKTAGPEDEKAIRQYRDLVAKATGVRHWWHDTFVFHLTLAYEIKPLGEKKKEIQPVIDKWTERVRNRVGAILLPRGEFVVFNDMMAYYNDLDKRGDMY